MLGAVIAASRREQRNVLGSWLVDVWFENEATLATADNMLTRWQVRAWKIGLGEIRMPV